MNQRAETKDKAEKNCLIYRRTALKSRDGEHPYKIRKKRNSFIANAQQSKHSDKNNLQILSTVLVCVYQCDSGVAYVS